MNNNHQECIDCGNLFNPNTENNWTCPVCDGQPSSALENRR